MLSPTTDLGPRRRRSARPRPTSDNPATHPTLTRREARARARTGEHPADAPIPHTDGDSRQAASPIDPFEAAARLFSFGTTRSTPDGRVEPASRTPEPAASKTAQPGETAAARSRKATGMRAVTFSARILGLVGVMTVGMTVDAEALPHEHNPTALVAATGIGVQDVQAYVAPAQSMNPASIKRDNYATETLLDRAGTAGITNFSSAVFTNNSTCAVQWPYAVGVPMTYGFGMRSGRMHQGTDFVPGAGAQIQAIADGVVSVSTDSGGAYGVTIVIDHVVEGQLVSSRYAHMEYDSRQVQVGDTVRAGQYIGRTGNTGRSFGAHLHFEVLLDGTNATDPLPWLRSYATC